MFFFFPINTDAPVYHFPWATLSLILANCFIFAASITGEVPVEEWALTYGQINPLQWVTSNFIHGGIGHLLGNMFFLWGLGLIVEGKIGWRAFSVLYFGIGISECAIEQLCMLAADGASFGASSIIFGLMAIAIVWAPKNEVSFFYFFWVLFFIRAGVFEITIMVYGLFVVAKEAVVFALLGFHVGSAALHLLGGVVGYAVGVFMLKRNMVDCEGWDLFSVMKGKHGRVTGDPSNFDGGLFSRGKKTKKKRKRNRQPSRMLTESGGELTALTEETAGRSSSPEQSRKKILRCLAENKPQAALTELRRQQHLNPAFQLDPRPLRKLAQGMVEQQQWSDAVELLEEYVERFEQGVDAVRILLASVLVQKQRRPRAALNVLADVDNSQIPEKSRQRIAQLNQLADELIESGVIELQGQAFSSE